MWGLRRGSSECSVFYSDHWLVSEVNLYRAIPAFPALLPEGSLVGLADGSPPRALRKFLVDREARPDSAALTAVPRTFVRARFLPVDQATMAGLAALAETCAEPEIAIHLIALHAGTPVLEWYDIPDDPLGVTSVVAEDEVVKFAKTVGGRFALETVANK